MQMAKVQHRASLAAVISCGLLLSACQTAGVSGVPIDRSAGSAANIDSLNAVIEANPRDAAAYNTRGIAYGQAGRFNKK